MEDQKIYDTVALAARNSIYGTKDDDLRFRMILQRLGGAKEEIAETAGGIAGATIGNISLAAQKQQRQIPADVLLAATDETVDNVLEIAGTAGLIEKPETIKGEAMKAALRMVGKTELQSMTPEKKQGAQAALQQMQKPGLVESRRNNG